MVERPIETVLARLIYAKQTKCGWKARCPAHNDQEPSLSISEGIDGRVLVHCHAGCSVESIAGALGMRVSDLFVDGSATGKCQRQSLTLKVTLEELAQHKGLPVHFLQQLGLRDLPDEGVGIPYRDANGEEVLVKQRTALAAKAGSYWPSSTPLMPYGLDRVKEFGQKGNVVLVEGESDCWTGWFHGLPFLGVPGANATKVLTDDVLYDFKRIYVVREPDGGGDVFVEGIARRLADSNWRGEALVVRLPDAKDANELHCKHPDHGEFLALFQQAMDAAQVLPPASDEVRTQESEENRSFGVVCLSDIRPAMVEWLIPGIIPMGKLTLIAGNPGVAKSTVTLAIAAGLSVGKRWPDGELTSPANTLILSAEDGLADTVLPRLMAAGGDGSRVLALKELPGKKGHSKPVILPDDIPSIKDIVTQRGVRLVIVDPLNAFLSGALNSWKDADIRRVLTPLAAMAEKTRAAVVLVAHLNKAAEQDALYRVGGSIALVAAARSAFLVAVDPNDHERRLILPLKSNLTKEPKSMVIHLENTSYGAARVVFDGYCDFTAGDVLTAPEVTDEERSALLDATDFLKRQLALGPMAQASILNYATADGIAGRTLNRAKKALGVKSRRVVSYGVAQWVWELPAQIDTNSNIANDYIPSLAMLDGIGNLSEDTQNRQVMVGMDL